VLDHAQGRHVLKRARRGRGFSLIELMIVLVLVGIGLVMAVRAFAGWAADGRARATAESLLNALRVAQANAVSNNRVVVFSLTAASPAVDAAPSRSGQNWFSALVPLAGSGTTGTTLIQADTVASRYAVGITGSPTLAGASTSGTSAPLCFNSLGQLSSQSAAAIGLSSGCTAPADGLPVVYLVSGVSASRLFKVYVYPGGQMRMCDAARALSNDYPDGCP
jgi:type IV fimbrial biogenesis protein FimT